MTSTTCLWCHNTLLRHVRRSGVYWFCNSCRQEIHPHLVDASQAQQPDAPAPDPSDFVDAHGPFQIAAALGISDEFSALPPLESRPTPESPVAG